MSSIIHYSVTHTKPRNPNHSGAQAKLARVTGYFPNIIYGLVKGRRNAGPDRAARLAVLTGSSPDIWLPGGSPEDRRAAVEAWAAGLSPGEDEGREHV